MNAATTQPVLDVVHAWTGVEPVGCPWAAFRDELVARVLHVYEAYDKGQLALFAPNPSHRLIEGVQHYSQALSVCRSKRMEQERERLESERKRAQGRRDGTVVRGRG